MKKLSHKEFLDKLYLVNQNIEILEQYINSSTKIKCRCKIDNHEWYTTPNGLLSGKGCPICASRNYIKLASKNHEDFVSEIKQVNPNIEVLGKYLNNHTKIRCKCLIDGNVWDALPLCLLRGSGCRVCQYRELSYSFTLSDEEFTRRLKKVNDNIGLLEPYKNMKTKIKLKCCLDGYEWTALPKELLRGRGCPECKRRNLSGNKNNKWKGGISPLSSYVRTFLRQWKCDSIINCNYKSIISNKKYEVVHHLYSFNKILSETLEILNLPVYDQINLYSESELKQIVDTCVNLHYKYGLGVCLTEDEHILFHNIYGREYNTKEQFKEYLLQQRTTIADLM